MLFVPPIPQPRTPLLLKYPSICLSRRHSSGKGSAVEPPNADVGAADGIQWRSPVATGIGSDEAKGEGRQFRSKFPHPCSKLGHKIGPGLPRFLLARK